MSSSAKVTELAAAEVGFTPSSWTPKSLPRLQNEVLVRGLQAGVPQAEGEVLPWKQGSQLPALPGLLPESLTRSPAASQPGGLQWPGRRGRAALRPLGQATRAHGASLWWGGGGHFQGDGSRALRSPSFSTGSSSIAGLAQSGGHG